MGKLVYRGCEIEINIKTLMDPNKFLYFSIFDNGSNISSGAFEPDTTIRDVFETLRTTIDYHRYDPNNFEDVTENYYSNYNYCPYCGEKIRNKIEI